MSLPVWLPGPMFLLEGLCPGGSLSSGDGGSLLRGSTHPTGMTVNSVSGTWDYIRAQDDLGLSTGNILGWSYILHINECGVKDVHQHKSSLLFRTNTAEVTCCCRQVFI